VVSDEIFEFGISNFRAMRYKKDSDSGGCAMEQVFSERSSEWSDNILQIVEYESKRGISVNLNIKWRVGTSETAGDGIPIIGLSGCVPDPPLYIQPHANTSFTLALDYQKNVVAAKGK
jgi:hypothetical protein